MRMASALKTIVSKNKRRLVEDGFNLDLSYINERVIAMGFPAESVESLYRNSLDEVKRFLEQKHSGHYFIYNLCSERFYDVKKFHGRVANYPFDDHHPPDFSSIKPFCDDVEGWLERDPRNVAVVHCKAGKGRTGVMICCHLLHSKKFSTAEDVLEYYGQQRTMDRKGVTIPSQRRYINYYASVVRERLTYRPVKLYLRSLVVDPIPSFGNLPGSAGHEFYLQFEVKQTGGQVPNYASPDFAVRKGERQVRLDVDPPLLLCGDVKVEFTSKLKLLDNFGLMRSKLTPAKKEFHFWFNTFFVDNPFSSDLSYSVTSSASTTAPAGGVTLSAPATASSGVTDPPVFSPGCSVGEEDEAASSSNEGLVQAGGEGAAKNLLAASASNGGGGVYQNRLRSYPAPERHASCIAGGSTVAGGGGGNGAGAPADEQEGLTNLMKHTSISDDHLLQDRGGGGAPSAVGAHVPVRQHHSSGHPQHNQNHPHPHHPAVGAALPRHHPMATSTSSSSSSSSSSNANSGAASATTLLSFNDIRKRHSSVPQPARSSPGAFKSVAHFHHSSHDGPVSSAVSSSPHRLDPPPPALDIPGSPVSLRLSKPQVDKAFKDKQCKVYPEGFQVMLFLLRPEDQSDAGKLSSSPVCLKGSGDGCASATATGGVNANCGHCSSSSEEDTTDSEAVSSSASTSAFPAGHQQQQRQQQQQQHSHLFQSEWI